VVALSRLMRPASAKTAPSCAMIRIQNTARLTSTVSMIAGLWLTNQATNAVAHSPAVIQA